MSGFGSLFGGIFSQPSEKPPPKVETPVESAKPADSPKPSSPSVEDLWWVKKARAEVGVKEKRGGETARIIYYHSFTTLKADEDEVPWCSSFMCFIFNGGTKSAAAKSYASYGQHLDKFYPGCIVVMSRTGGNHVTLGISEHGDQFRGLGGNQGDQVCEATEPKSRVIAYRWPPGEPLPH